MVDLDKPGPGGPRPLPTPEVRAPWWAWGLVAAVPFGLLGLCCHWFSVPDPNGFDGPHEYGAFSVAYLSALGPVFLIGQGITWFGALREWWGVPTERNWQGKSPGDRVAGPIARAVAGIGESIRPGDPADQVILRGAAALAAAVGCAALLLLGISRWTVPNGFFDPNTHTTGHLPVHLVFGFWCALLSDLLFVAFGLIGCVPWPLRRPPAPASARSWWVLGEEGAGGVAGGAGGAGRAGDGGAGGAGADGAGGAGADGAGRAGADGAEGTAEDGAERTAQGVSGRTAESVARRAGRAGSRAACLGGTAFLGSASRAQGARRPCGGGAGGCHG